MGAFQTIQREIQSPGKLVTLAPGDFADEWKGRPKSNIVVGIRLLPAYEEDSARNVARDAGETGGVDAYNRAAMAWVVARALCDPNNHAKSHPTFPAAEDTVAACFTGPALTRLFDEVERYQVESSSLFKEASDEEVLDLVTLLDGQVALSELEASKQARVRRYLAFALEELTSVEIGQ